MQFETADVTMRGQMTVTFTLADAAGGTDVEAVHDNVPAGVVPAENELGWRMALGKLAALVESRPADLRRESVSAFDMELKRTGGLSRLLNAVGYSAAGLRHAIRHEASIREALLALAVLVPVALLLPVSRLEQLLLVLSMLLVVTLELFNSAIEAVVDRISMERHPLSGQAKDMASAAVAIAMLMTGITWIVIAGPVVWSWLR
jgi:diacylglycerol kinase (ATP)